jgi:hypothetical protein
LLEIIRHLKELLGCRKIILDRQDLEDIVSEQQKRNLSYAESVPPLGKLTPNVTEIPRGRGRGERGRGRGERGRGWIPRERGREEVKAVSLEDLVAKFQGMR